MATSTSQFTSREFKDFCKSYQIDLVTTAPFHPPSYGRAERFVDNLKRALKKGRVTPTEKALQEFLQVYRITPNNKTPASQWPAKVMFAPKIRSVYDKLLPQLTKTGRTNIVPTKRYNPREKGFFRIFKDNKPFLGGGYDRKKSWEYDLHCKGFTIHV